MCLAHGIAPHFHVRTGAYPYGNVAAYVASGRQRRKALTVSAEKTPCISAIDTTNFARQIVLDFEFAPVPKQRQRRGLRNEIIEVGAVKLDYHGNVMGEFSQFVQTEFTEGVAFPVRELTGISAVDTAMADPLYVVIKRLNDLIGRYSAQVVCWSGTDRRQLLTECRAKHIDLSAFPTDWADLQAFYTSIMDVGSHGCVSLGDAATCFGFNASFMPVSLCSMPLVEAECRSATCSMSELPFDQFLSSSFGRERQRSRYPLLAYETRSP